MSRIKKLEQEIKELKDKVLELQSQIINLQLQRGVVVTLPPSTLPEVHPAIPQPYWPTYPYIGDPPHEYGRPTITCGSTMSSDLNLQSRQNIQGSAKTGHCIQ